VEVIEVQCRCGAIKLEVKADPIAQLYCHCNDCRIAHGAAYVASSIYPAQSVEVTKGEPTPIVVKTTPRMRCVTCGTHLFSDIVDPGLRSVNAFLLPKEAFNPQLHVNCQDAILPVVDKLPHYKAFPAAYGGAEEFVTW
jgi:hypothetical protein